MVSVIAKRCDNVDVQPAAPDFYEERGEGGTLIDERPSLTERAQARIILLLPKVICSLRLPRPPAVRDMLRETGYRTF